MPCTKWTTKARRWRLCTASAEAAARELAAATLGCRGAFTTRPPSASPRRATPSTRTPAPTRRGSPTSRVRCTATGCGRGLLASCRGPQRSRASTARWTASCCSTTWLTSPATPRGAAATAPIRLGRWTPRSARPRRRLTALSCQSGTTRKRTSRRWRGTWAKSSYSRGRPTISGNGTKSTTCATATSSSASRRCVRASNTSGQRASFGSRTTRRTPDGDCATPDGDASSGGGRASMLWTRGAALPASRKDDNLD
mmetsp:Transcript_15055/g.51687  ORF Transcript_15055/g.51687 Transcript_15055/m.51687 type:complete len:255 (+) Transcript_15055:930-1694(+)